MFRKYNPNPSRLHVGDCVIRSITSATGDIWENVYIELALQGYMMHDMPSANRVWGEYLHNHGFKRRIIPDTCPDCYTVKDFCEDYPQGTYVVSTGTHAVCIKSGDYYDTWDSGNEPVIYYWTKEE